MKADRTPEIPGPTQKQAKEKSEHHNCLRAYRILIGIEGMAQAEQAGHYERRGPEADSGRESVLDVSAKQEFFNQSDEEECDAPPDQRRHNCFAVQSQADNTEPMEKEHRQQGAADSQKTQERPDPEIPSQALTQGQTIFAELAILKFAHDQSSAAEKQQRDRF